jgi:hypothetical protein
MFQFEKKIYKISCVIAVFYAVNFSILMGVGTGSLDVGWSMKFRETKFRERIPFVFREIFMFISRNFVSRNKRNFAKFLPRNFVSCLTKQKNNVAVTEQETSPSFLSPFST